MSDSGKILIIDDEAKSRDVLEALLDRLGHQLLFAENAMQGLAVARETLPDLILLDVMMPDMNGFDACLRLRADPCLAEVPVVMVTALDDQDARLRGLECGADDFINKPLNRAELLARVKTIMRLNRYRRLNEERAKLAWIAEQAEEGYVLTSPDDEILYLNPRARLYLHVGEDDWQGHTFVELACRHYHCEPTTAWQNWPHNSTLEQEALYLIQPESTTANALWLWVRAYVAEGLERLLELRDVSMYMNTMRNMQTFHGMIQHKLRTPLEPLISGLNFLKQNYEEINTETRIEFLDMAIQGAYRLSNELGRILNYLNSHKIISELGDGTTLGEMAQHIALISEHLQLGNVEVRVADSLRGITTSLGMQNLECILVELLQNAKKFHPRQTPVIHVEFDPVPENQYFRLRVSDDGQSLTPEQIARAWTPYYQGEKYFTGQAPGMGLGLPTIASLVWQVGGHCRLYNRNPPPGVTVELELPCGIFVDNAD